MCDMCITGAGGSSIKCYSVLIGSLSPLVHDLLKIGQSTQLILPDFTIQDIMNLMNLVYTGEYVLHNFFLHHLKHLTLDRLWVKGVSTAYKIS
jgi:hypothetical protein